jgi:ribosomal protein S30
MGKVHGSLARAGKVKSQTPKVCYFLIEREERGPRSGKLRDGYLCDGAARVG